MKIGIISDEHLSIKDKALGNSSKPTNVFESINWARQTFENEGCEIVIHGGDLTNSDTLTSEEITLLSRIFENQYSYEEYFLLGNHERRSGDGQFNALNFINNYPGKTVISDTLVINPNPNTNQVIIFQPYRKDNTYNNLYQTIDEQLAQGKLISVISHAFYIGIDYEGYCCPEGINYNLLKTKGVQNIFNGHIHYVYDEGIYHQIGNPTGLNFSDNYKFGYPNIIIWDTDTNKVERITNPDSYLFIKVKYEDNDDADKIELIKLTNNYKYVRIDCNSKKVDEIRAYIEEHKQDLRILDYSIKINTDSTLLQTEQDKVDLNIYNSPSKALTDFVKTEEETPYSKEELLEYIRSYVK